MKHRFALIILVWAGFSSCSNDTNSPFPVYDEGEVIWQVGEYRDIGKLIITPDGQQLIFVQRSVTFDRSNLNFVKYDLTTGIESIVIENGYDPDISPDGKWLVFRSYFSPAIGKIKLSGESLTQLTESYGNNHRPIWHPDGKTIAYFHADSASRGLYILRGDNSTEVIPIFSNGYIDFFPDGKSVVITEFNKFLVYNLETTQLLEIAMSSDYVLNSLEVSPDGNKILYSNSEGIFIMNSDGTNTHLVLPKTASHIRLGSVGFVATNPTWYPDGKHIIYKNIAITGTIPCCAGCYCLGPTYKGIVSIRKIRVF